MNARLNTSKLKNIRTFCGATLWIILLASASWGQVAPELDWRQANRLRASQLDSIAPQDNGYLILKDLCAQPYEKATWKATRPRLELYKSLNPHWQYWPDRPSLSGPQFEQDRKQFQQVLPEFLEAIKRPEFHWPSHWEQGLEASVPNLRVLSLGCTSLAVEALFKQDLSLMLQPLALAQHLSGKALLVQQKTAIRCGVVGQEALFHFLPTCSLSSSELLDLQSKLESLRPESDDFVKSLDAEVDSQLISAERFLAGQISDDDMRGVYADDSKAVEKFLPLCQNFYQRYRLIMLKQAPLQNWKSKLEADLEETAQRHGKAGSMVRGIFTPTLAGPYGSWQQFLQRQDALELVVALLHFKREHGDYPQDLAQLSHSPIGWSKLGYRKTESGFSLDAPIWIDTTDKLRRF